MVIRTQLNTPGDALWFSRVSLHPALSSPALCYTLVQPSCCPQTLSPDSSAQGAHQALLGVPASWPGSSAHSEPRGLPSMVSCLSGTPVLPCMLSCVLKTIPELFAVVPGGSVSQSLFLHLDWKWKLLPVETQILSCAVTTGPVWRRTRVHTHRQP